MKNLKNKSPLVSIIIRTKNEERWITSCLNSVFAQSYNKFEVIIVDNMSDDTTLKRIKTYPVKLVKIKLFFPGKALNEGIRSSKGDIIVCLSGHCIPVNKDWLKNIVYELNDEKVAGVYGRQQPLAYSSDTDKRDLINLFGLDKKIQIKDPFFHNANSAFKKKTWKKFPFDEKLTNIEDRAWGKEVIKNGYKIIYEPSASVFHWHGVHHDMNPQRAKNVVKILENIELNSSKNIKPKNKKVYAIIPIKGNSKLINNKLLLDYTLKVLLSSKKINKVFVVTDSKKIAEVAKKRGAIVPFIRPKHLSESFISIVDVIQYTLEQIKNDYDTPDLVGIFEEVYPFRNLKMVDDMISEIILRNYDTLIAAKYEPRGIFINNNYNTDMMVERFMPSKLKPNKMYVGLLGLGCIVKTHLIQTGEILGKTVGLFEINNPYSPISIKTNEDLSIFKSLIKDKNILK